MTTDFPVACSAARAMTPGTARPHALGDCQGRDVDKAPAPGLGLRRREF